MSIKVSITPLPQEADDENSIGQFKPAMLPVADLSPPAIPLMLHLAVISSSKVGRTVVG